MNLDQITARFSRAYDKSTRAKDDLTARQKEMFDAFTKELGEGPLARRSVHMEYWKNLLGKEQDAWLKKHHPGFRYVDYSYPWVIIEEDPALLKHTHINRKNGLVYGRTRVEGKPGLDDEALRAENPELWERITVWPEPWYSLVKEVIQRSFSLPMSHDTLEDHIGGYLERYNVQRTLKDFSDITDEDLMDLEVYLLPGPVSVRLVPPREVKPEELEGHAEEEEF